LVVFDQLIATVHAAGELAFFSFAPMSNTIRSARSWYRPTGNRERCQEVIPNDRATPLLVLIVPQAKRPLSRAGSRRARCSIADADVQFAVNFMWNMFAGDDFLSYQADK
jgi:hypothetical protein